MSHRVLSANSLAGNGVRNPDGQDLGKITDIMIDLPTGRIAYAVLSFGGFLGLGDKLFAIPWAAMKLDTRDHEFILNVSKEVLTEAEGFDKDDWPDFADLEVGTRIHRHYKIRPYWED